MKCCVILARCTNYVTDRTPMFAVHVRKVEYNMIAKVYNQNK